MTFGYLLIALILFCCILADRFSGKFGMPALILFMGVGMLFGSDGLLKIQFDNYELAERVCSAALVFIMFYGGFNTNWKTAKNVAVRAILLSTVGVVITAGLTAGFCYFALGLSVVQAAGLSFHAVRPRNLRHDLACQRLLHHCCGEFSHRCGIVLHRCSQRIFHFERKEPEFEGRNGASFGNRKR